VAVVAYFRTDITRIVRAVLEGIFDGKPFGSNDARLGWMIAAGTLPIVLFGLLFKDHIESTLRSLLVICVSLIVVALAMELAEQLMGRRIRNHIAQKPLDRVSWTDAAIIGFAQALALVPGTSRSGVTITAGLFRGLDRSSAARFSFLLSLPSIFAAGVYQLVKQWEELTTQPHDALNLAVATAVSGVVGYAAIAFLLRYLRTRSMRIFVVYRIVLSIALLGLLWSGRISDDKPAKTKESSISPGFSLQPTQSSD
jgi:undecaprenyl-diphosphatase